MAELEAESAREAARAARRQVKLEVITKKCCKILMAAVKLAEEGRKERSLRRRVQLQQIQNLRRQLLSTSKRRKENTAKRIAQVNNSVTMMVETQPVEAEILLLSAEPIGRRRRRSDRRRRKQRKKRRKGGRI